MAKEIRNAMLAIEEFRPELEGVLPKDEYVQLTRTDRTIPAQLLKTFSNILSDASGDILGKIYEYFLSNFALAEGQGGGEFFTPTSVIQLMVEIIEPYSGKVYDPACGSGGMFVQSKKFIESHRNELEEMNGLSSADSIYVYGQEKTLDTVKLAKMNLVVNGLRGEIKQANSYTEDLFKEVRKEEKFDYVMANPPFNVFDVPIANVEEDPRFNTYGIPRNKTKNKNNNSGKETVPNANYLWISLCATSLSDKGRAALVMANSASDAHHSESDIRKKIIENNLIYGMLALPSNMFFTVTLPATLWFFDKNKRDDNILFIDARNVFTQVDRAHRKFSDEQIQNIAIIIKPHKGKRVSFIQLIDTYFAKGMALIKQNQEQAKLVCDQIIMVLDDVQGQQAMKYLSERWQSLKPLQDTYQAYVNKSDKNLVDDTVLTNKNKQQHQLREEFEPFFELLETCLKQIGKIVRHHERNIEEKAKADGKRIVLDRATKQLKELLGLEVKRL